ncbi:hypothetical protein D7Y13_25850 [Corallococcus praedator]|uniref:Beta-ketoacyl synthase N-terminal domain-containing protein n=1 Tax=Corallococcus praedator TaxID=2316724 RepID=A0ABX9QC51_9BACT|nr:hypothetical protein D7X75_31235 [Corallococcus sp. CA031C]RKI00977.1 hypothetical protein D7Y13_25850 [Corallococcus praedator]
MSLSITGLGLVCTLGHDVVSGCAALRCGMSRPHPLALQVASTGDEPGVEPVVGHPLRGLSDGFVGLGLYGLLAEEAIRDLLAYTKLALDDERFWEGTGLFLCLPGARTPMQEESELLLRERLAPLIMRRTRLGIRPGSQRVVARGNISVLAAMAEAAAAFSEGRFQRALIVAVDSLTRDLDVLEALAMSRRLKTPQHPVGLMPGEAAAALLVEGEAGVGRPGARVEARVEALHVRDIPDADLPREGPPNVLGLAEVLERTLERSNRVGDVYGDLNGEESRAMEWGMALARLRARPVLAGARTHWPAISLGDTGAVSGAISVAAATRSFVRDYAHGDEILIWSRSDTGSVASGLLIRPRE